MRHRLLLLCNLLSLVLVLASALGILASISTRYSDWIIPWHPSGRGYTIIWIERMRFVIALDRPLEVPVLSQSQIPAWGRTRCLHWAELAGFRYLVGETVIYGAFGIKQYDYRHAIGFPLWAPLTIGCFLPARTAGGAIRRRRRCRNGLCQICGYDLRASTSACPECGALRTCGATNTLS